MWHFYLHPNFTKHPQSKIRWPVPCFQRLFHPRPHPRSGSPIWLRPLSSLQFLVLFPWVIWEWLDPIAAFSPIRSEADNNPWFLKAVLDLFHPSLLPCVTFASVLNICSKRGTLVSHSEPSNVNQSSYDILQSMFHCKYYVQALWNVACMAPCDTWLPWQYTFWLNYSISPWNIHC